MSTEHLLQDVGNILDALMSPEDGPRELAEQHLRQLALQDHAKILLVLAQIGAQGVGGFQIDQRFLALIVLRRVAFRALPGLLLHSQSRTASAPWDVLRETSRQRIETVLCAGLRDERNVRMRKGLGTCVAEWAAHSSSRVRPFLALAAVLLELSTSDEPFHLFTAFQILNLTPTVLIDHADRPFENAQLIRILLGGLSDPSVDVRIEAVRATSSVLIGKGVNRIERLRIGPELVQHTFITLTTLPVEGLSLGLVAVVDMATSYPRIFINVLDDTMPLLLSLLSPPDFESLVNLSPYPASNLQVEDWESVSNPATEILMCVLESKKRAFGFWETGRIVREMISLLLCRMVYGLLEDGEDCQEWLEQMTVDDDELISENETHKSIDRLFLAVCDDENNSGKFAFTTTLSCARQLLALPVWQYRYVALIALTCLSEHCLSLENPKADMALILEMIGPYARNSHPRVRYAFIHCVHKLSLHDENILQQNYATQTITVSMELIQDPIARVRAYAATSLASFAYASDESTLQPFLGKITKLLVVVFNAGPVYVQEAVIAALADIATVVGSHFQPYGNDIIEFCIQAVQSNTHAGHRKLVGKIVHGITVIGLAIRKAAFAPYTVRLAQIMLGIQNSITDFDDPRIGELHDSWCNMARILGRDFAPFLQHVIPPLLQTASFKPSSSVSNPGSGDPESMLGDDAAAGDDIPNTSEMEDKALAFDLLTVYAWAMKDALEPWLHPCMQLSLEALGYTQSWEVRESAAFLIPGLLQVAKDARSWSVNSIILEQVFRELVNAIVRETDYDFLSLLYKSLHDSIRVLDTQLPGSIVYHVLRSTLARIRDIKSRREDRAYNFNYQDEPDQELEEMDHGVESVCMGKMKEMVELLGKYNMEAAKELVEVMGELEVVERMVMRESGGGAVVLAAMDRDGHEWEEEEGEGHRDGIEKVIQEGKADGAERNLAMDEG